MESIQKLPSVISILHSHILFNPDQWNSLKLLTHISFTGSSMVCDDECWKQLLYCVTVTSLFQINELCEGESLHKRLVLYG